MSYIEYNGGFCPRGFCLGGGGVVQGDFVLEPMSDCSTVSFSACLGSSTSDCKRNFETYC